MDALSLVESEGVLPNLWEAADGVRCAQEGAEGPGRGSVLPDGDGDTQVHCVSPDPSGNQSGCPGPAGPASQEEVQDDPDTLVS